jgi:signal transduction histidine kinase
MSELDFTGQDVDGMEFSMRGARRAGAVESRLPESLWRASISIGSQLWSTLQALIDARSVAAAKLKAYEDLTEALRLARDDALRKRFEAEAGNASKTIFVAHMSHGMRTPLNSVSGITELLLLKGGLTPEQTEYVQAIRSATAELQTWVDDMLDIGRIETSSLVLEPKLVDPSELVREVLEAFSSRAKAKWVELELVDKHSSGDIVVDRRRLKQVLANLVENAICFTPLSGGRVELKIEDLKASDSIKFSVKDNGVGIPQERIALLFKRLPVHNRYDSNANRGLGLFISAGLVELMGGQIEVHSEVGKGSVFAFSVPTEAQSR